MRRMAFLAVLLMVVGGALAYADEGHGSTKLTIEPSQMKDGETKTLVDGDKTITVTRHGDSVDVKIDGAGKTQTITVDNGGGVIKIYRDGASFRTVPGVGKIWIDGKELDGNLPRSFQRRPQHAQTWFVCPKDHTMLRVPEEKADQTYKCPVDGTTMEKRKGRGLAVFIDPGEHL